MLTATQQKVYDALCDGLVYDFIHHSCVYLRPRRVAIAAAVSYDTTRRALAKLHELGLIEKLSNEDEFITTELYYSPGWSHENGTGSPYLTEWEREVDTRHQALHLSPYAARLQREDERLQWRRWQTWPAWPR